MDFAFLKSLNLSEAGDWAVFLIFLAVAFIYGLSMGRNRLTIMILGAYFSFILTKAIPWQELSFKEIPNSSTLIFIFLGMILGFFFLIPSSSFNMILRSQSRRRAEWWQIMILSVLQIGLILEIVFTFLPEKITATLSPLAQTIFVGPLEYFMWILLPILAIMFLKARY